MWKQSNLSVWLEGAASRSEHAGSPLLLDQASLAGFVDGLDARLHV